MSAPPTSQTLLFKLRDPENATAWEAFAELYTPLIYNFAAFRGLSHEDASDVTQETLKSVASAIKKFEYDISKGTFRSWLYTVARSKLTNHFKKSAKQPKGTGRSTIQKIIAETPDPASEDARQREHWDHDYRCRMFEWACANTRHEFTASTWDAFWLCAVDQLEPADAAERLGLSHGAVHVAKHRVIRRLRDKIQSVTGDFDLPSQVA